jgi:hypothetical protein
MINFCLSRHALKLFIKLLIFQRFLTITAKDNELMTNKDLNRFLEKPRLGDKLLLIKLKL